MPNRFDFDYGDSDFRRLRAISDACSNIRHFRGEDRFPPDVANAWNYWQLIKIGEAARTMSSKVQNDLPTVPWRQIGNTRNVLVHEYWKIQGRIIRHIITEEVDPLASVIEDYLEGLEPE